MSLSFFHRLTFFHHSRLGAKSQTSKAQDGSTSHIHCSQLDTSAQLWTDILNIQCSSKAHLRPQHSWHQHRRGSWQQSVPLQLRRIVSLDPSWFPAESVRQWDVRNRAANGHHWIFKSHIERNSKHFIAFSAQRRQKCAEVTAIHVVPQRGNVTTKTWGFWRIIKNHWSFDCSVVRAAMFWHHGPNWIQSDQT